jgi:predicted 3-demethylubiquinone-9 3-methyltransferase (glyoxalase superfamily)
MQTIAPCLWFDTQAEEAARFYVGIFRNAKLGRISHFPDSGQEVHGKPAGSVMTVEFTLDGQDFIGLNGGPHFKFNEAVSLTINCDSQQEIDHYWEKLGAGGEPRAQQCGWLKDKFGLSWQVVPSEMAKMMIDPDPQKVKRAFAAMMEMKKLDIAALRKAFDGK